MSSNLTGVTNKFFKILLVSFSKKACLAARPVYTISKQTRSVFLQHGSTGAIATCMLLPLWGMPTTLYVEGSIPSPGCPG
ncbi:MAG: hypothetical protein QM791_18830 [Ferruginibacter sp.]